MPNNENFEVSALELNRQNQDLLITLSTCLLHIRRLSGYGNVNLSIEEKMQKINEISDLSHNIPHVLLKGGAGHGLDFLLSNELKKLLSEV